MRRCMRILASVDMYAVLGVARTSSTEDIKRAYREKAMTSHPDQGGSSDVFAQINEAYATLIDPNLRFQHDYNRPVPKEERVVDGIFRDFHKARRSSTVFGGDPSSTGLVGTYVEAIDYDPSNANAFASLGVALRAAGRTTVTLRDGRAMTDVALFLEALRLDGALAAAYHGLGNAISGEVHMRCTLADGRKLGREEIFLEAIRHGGSAHYDLAVSMTDTHHVRIHGVAMTKRDLLVEAIHHAPCHADAYLELGHCSGMGGLSSVRLRDGRVMTRRDLYVEAIHHDASRVESYRCLAMTMSSESGDTVVLKDHRVMGKADLEAVRV